MIYVLVHVVRLTNPSMMCKDGVTEEVAVATNRDPRVLSDKELLDEYEEVWAIYNQLLIKQTDAEERQKHWDRSKALRAEIASRLGTLRKEVKTAKRKRSIIPSGYFAGGHFEGHLD